MTSIPNRLIHPPSRQHLRLSNTMWTHAVFATPLILSSLSLLPVTALAQSRPAPIQDGYTLLERGWVNDAIPQFQQAVRLYPNSIDAQLGLAIAYQRNGQDADAWSTYQRVLQLDATNPTALSAIGLLSSYRPDWHLPGIAALTTLLEQTPNDLNARAQRALLYGYQGQFVDAIADYDIVLRHNPSPDILLNAAQIYTYSGHYPEGLSLFQRYQATNASIPDTALAAYATTLMETGDRDTAIEILETRLQSPLPSDSTDTDLRTTLAIAYQQNGDPSQALHILHPLRNRDSATLALARALSTIGRQIHDPALTADAIAYYRTALDTLDTPSVGLRIEVADVLSEYPPTRADALALYQSLIAEAPDDRSLLVKSFVLEHELGTLSRDDLAHQLVEVITPLPESTTAQRQIALALLRLDPPLERLTPIYQQLADANLNVPFLDLRLAQLAITANDFATARTAIDRYRTTPMGQTDLTPELLLAEIDRRSGNLDASAQRYQRLIDQTSDLALRKGAMRSLAGLYIAQHQLNDARNLYAQILSLDPSDLPSQLGQASVDYQLQTLSAADAEQIILAWFEAAPTAVPPPELFNLVSALPADVDRLPLYNLLLSANPNDFGIHRRWVMVMAPQDPDQAEARVNDLIAQNPDRIEVYFIQGEFAQGQGELELASQSYHTVLEQDPENVDALAALAGVRFQQQRYDEARQWYTQALTLAPDTIEFRLALAELSAAEGQSVSAWQQFNAIRLEQLESGIDSRTLQDRQQQLEVNMLRQRGFQPNWERY